MLIDTIIHSQCTNEVGVVLNHPISESVVLKLQLETISDKHDYFLIPFPFEEFPLPTEIAGNASNRLHTVAGSSRIMLQYGNRCCNIGNIVTNGTVTVTLVQCQY